MGDNEFINFKNFIFETTGRYPVELGNTFRDIYIYVPYGQIPPETNHEYSFSCQQIPHMSIKKFFSKLHPEFTKLVYNKNWHLLEYYLGTRLLRFCLVNCIFAKKTRFGTFIVSNLNDLCTKITNRPQQKLNEIFYRTAKYYEGEKETIKHNKRSVNLNNNKPHIDCNKSTQNLDNLFYSNGLEISTDNILCKTSRSRKFPDNHVLVNKDTKINMALQVLNTCVGKYKIVQYESCIEPLQLILKRFKKLHNKYNYEEAISRLVTKHAEDCCKRKRKYPSLANQLPLSVLKMFFTNICRSVIPTKLFCSNRNINILIKIICHLLETPIHQSVDMRSYIVQMKISDIGWLEGVRNTDTQWSILGKLMKWIFDKYILEIFRSQLYISPKTGYEKFYFKQKDWQRLTTQFLRKMRKDKVICNVRGLHTKLSCSGKWTFNPKKNGVRPIMSRIRGHRQNEMTKNALCYLQQLYLTKYGETGKPIFFEKWKDVVDKFRNNENKTMYLVCCDIQSAYESIDQKKLMKIVTSLADLTGPELSFASYTISRNFKTLKSKYFRSKKCIVYDELELPIVAKSVLAPGLGGVSKVSRKALLHEVRKHVLNQNVLLANQTYLLQQGIAQGAILSSVLCDIYYSHMEETNLSQFKNEGLLFRFVDDILFATENKALANRFLEHVNNGFPEYNCTFNPDKTSTNIPGHKHTVKTINYLGCIIDSETLEVTPDYPKNARYIILLSKPRSNTDGIATFRKRLGNIAALKLDGIILDYKINTEDTIINNIECAFRRQAERCLWLVDALFNDLPNQLGEIFKVIKLTNLKIIERIQRYFLSNGYDFEKLIPRLASIPWKSYRQVFGRRQTVYIHFQSLFLKSMKMAEQASVSS